MCNTSQCRLRYPFWNFRVTNVMFIVTYHTLPPREPSDSFWMTRSQRSRRRDKSLLLLCFVCLKWWTCAVDIHLFVCTVNVSLICFTGMHTRIYQWFRDHIRLGLCLGLYYWNAVIYDYFCIWTSVRYSDIDVGLICQRHWNFLIECWRRFQVNTWISMWALYFKGTGIFFVVTDVVYVVCWIRVQVDTCISMWALYFKGTDIFVLTAEYDFRSTLGYRCGPYKFKGTGIFFVLTDVVYVDCWRRFQVDTCISMWALYFKGTGIFLLTAQEDFRSILVYRCGPYISKALGFSYWLLRTVSVVYWVLTA